MSKGSKQFHVQRYYFTAQRHGIGREYADTVANGDRPVIGDADMKALCDAMTRRLAFARGAKRSPQGGRGCFAATLKLIK